MQEATKANPYVYAGNNPVNETDPSGKDGVTAACFWSTFLQLVFDIGDFLVVAGAKISADAAAGSAALAGETFDAGEITGTAAGLATDAALGASVTFWGAAIIGVLPYWPPSYML